MNGGRVQKARREQPPVLAAMDGIPVQCAVRKQDAAGYLELIALDVAQAKCREIGSHEQIRDQAGRFEKASGCIVDFHVGDSSASRGAFQATIAHYSDRLRRDRPLPRWTATLGRSGSYAFGEIDLRIR
jgi:hypothetical protein